MFKNPGPKQTLSFVHEEDEEAIEIASFRGAPSVLEVAKKNRIDVPFSCDGNATCGTCCIVVLEPSAQDLEPRNELEEEIASDRRLRPNERLACQLTAFEGLKIRIPKKSI